MKNYDGKKISDLANVIPLDSGYGTAFSYAAAESVDIIVCYADGRNDYEESWTLATDKQDSTGKQGMGRTESIWNELNVIGVTDGIYNDTVAISKRSPYYTDRMIPRLIAEHMSPVAAGITLIGPLAATMSTVSSLLIAASSAVVKDLLLNARPEWAAPGNERRLRSLAFFRKRSSPSNSASLVSSC